MSVSAAIKFVQGANVGTAGIALFADLAQGSAVTASNGDNSQVVRWTWTMLGAPGGSSVPVGLMSDGSFPTASFNWDVAGGYHLELITTDINGNQAKDRRVFGVLEASGLFIPPFDAEAPALNFAGQPFGWHPSMEGHLRSIHPATVTIPVLAIDWRASSVFQKTLAGGANAITFTNAFDKIIVVKLTGAGSTVSWPAGIKWPGGVAPTQTAAGTDVYTFVSIGGTIYGSVIQNFS